MKRYALIRTMDISNGEGIGISLFVQGCHFHCKNCFNPETWDFNGGKEWNEEVKERFIKLANGEHVNRISILGGEPLCQENVETILDLCRELKKLYPQKKIWIYTGYTWEYLVNQDFTKKLLENIDVLVDGPYVDELQDFNLRFRGSSNQRIINVSESLERGEVIMLYG